MKEIVRNAFMAMNTPLTACWHLLSKCQQRVMFLVFICDWDRKEVAEHYGITNQCVSAHIHVALKKIRARKITEQWRRKIA